MKMQSFPVYRTLGLVAFAATLGIYSLEHQLVYSPNVYVSKKMRKSSPEITDPNHIIDVASKFISKSFFRNVFHS
ncbi:hypothetical protein ZOSMA_767G00030 [Zostera marina]|uniref:Uncharacterized protein n=1 Tax=Zostera marina TaxID=29655 RepID=A0A0K9NR55_ZOSMR|nr:hypothetical protein ZOSMA_767G00030 [Zostera marina]